MSRHRNLKRLCGLVQKDWTETRAPLREIEARHGVPHGQALRWVRGLDRPKPSHHPRTVKTRRQEARERFAAVRAILAAKRERAVHLAATTTMTFTQIAAEVGCCVRTVWEWSAEVDRPAGALKHERVGAGPAFEHLNKKMRLCGIPAEERRRVIAAARAEREMRHAA